MKALNIIVLLAGLFAAVNSYAAGTVLMENTRGCLASEPERIRHKVSVHEVPRRLQKPCSKDKRLLSQPSLFSHGRS